MPLTSPETLTLPALQQLLSTDTFGRTGSIVPSTTSTNDLAKDCARRGAPEGTVVLAEHQTHGRGRQGRSFASPSGVGIYLSLLLRPRVATVLLPRLTLASAVATAEAVAAHCALPVALKWPNDLLIHGKKVAGILTEMVLTPGASPVAIVGIGVNVNTTLGDLPPELHAHVTSLALATGRSWPRLPLIARLLAHLERLYQAFQRGEMAAIRQQWLHYGQMIGQRVRFTQQRSPRTGTVIDLDEDGALLVQDTDGVQHRLIAGEVTFI